MLDKTKKYLTPVGSKEARCSVCRLTDFCLPRGLTQEEIIRLNIAERRLERNDVLYHAEEKSKKIYAVKSGSFKTLLTNSQGNEQVAGFYQPGNIIGLDGLGHRTQDSTAVALENSTVCEIHESALNTLCESNPNFSQYFLQIAGKEIIKKQQQIMLLGQMRGIARIAIFLVNQSHHFEERGYSATEFRLSMSRHDIASYLGLAVETLSREFKQLQTRGYLEVQRYDIKILDMDGLCELAGTPRRVR